MPTLRLILLRMFPVLSSTTRKYGTNGSFVGDKYSPDGMSRRNRSHVQTGGTGTKGSVVDRRGSRAGGAGGLGGGPGITYERSYAVHYHSAADASSQVQLKDLDAKGFEAASAVSECSA